MMIGPLLSSPNSISNLQLKSHDLEIENEKILKQALHMHAKATADFVQALFLAEGQCIGCGTMLTFDANAARMTAVKRVAG